MTYPCKLDRQGCQSRVYVVLEDYGFRTAIQLSLMKYFTHNIDQQKTTVYQTPKEIYAKEARNKSGRSSGVIHYVQIRDDNRAG